MNQKIQNECQMVAHVTFTLRSDNRNDMLNSFDHRYLMIGLVVSPKRFTFQTNPFAETANDSQNSYLIIGEGLGRLPITNIHLKTIEFYQVSFEDGNEGLFLLQTRLETVRMKDVSGIRIKLEFIRFLQKRTKTRLLFLNRKRRPLVTGGETRVVGGEGVVSTISSSLSLESSPRRKHLSANSSRLWLLDSPRRLPRWISSAINLSSAFHLYRFLSPTDTTQITLRSDLYSLK
ncbi:hypothetical protein YC2023_011708 [Brassica napus]